MKNHRIEIHQTHFFRFWSDSDNGDDDNGDDDNVDDDVGANDDGDYDKGDKNNFIDTDTKCKIESNHFSSRWRKSNQFRWKLDEWWMNENKLALKPCSASDDNLDNYSRASLATTKRQD